MNWKDIKWNETKNKCSGCSHSRTESRLYCSLHRRSVNEFNICDDWHESPKTRQNRRNVEDLRGGIWIIKLNSNRYVGQKLILPLNERVLNSNMKFYFNETEDISCAKKFKKRNTYEMMSYIRTFRGYSNPIKIRVDNYDISRERHDRIQNIVWDISKNYKKYMWNAFAWFTSISFITTVLMTLGWLIKCEINS